MSKKHPGSRHHKALNQWRWRRVRLRVLARDAYRCRLCGRAGRLEVDHVIPLARGGKPFDMDNLATVCVDCHREKTLRETGRLPGPRAQAWGHLIEELRRAV